MNSRACSRVESCWMSTREKQGSKKVGGERINWNHGCEDWVKEGSKCRKEKRVVKSCVRWETRSRWVGDLPSYKMQPPICFWSLRWTSPRQWQVQVMTTGPAARVEWKGEVKDSQHQWSQRGWPRQGRSCPGWWIFVICQFCVFFIPQKTFTKYLAFSKHSFRASQLPNFYPILSPSMLMGSLLPAFLLLLCQSSETTPLRTSKEFSPICKLTLSP